MGSEMSIRDSAEGFGLATLESLSCGTPIIANMTGGLQDQVRSGDEEFGVAIYPTAKAIIGSQTVPYIYEDRFNQGQFSSALTKLYSSSAESRAEMGMRGREHVIKNFNFDNFNKSWVDFMLEVYEQEGSWETRNYHGNINLLEVA